MTSSTNELLSSSSIVDHEIDSVEDDAFGHRDFALLLRSIIEDDSHRLPYSVGLLGSWGTGKSSITSLYRADLRNDTTKIEGHRRSLRTQTITFNAWRYGGENIKRALLRHVYLALGGQKANLYDELFHQNQILMKQPKSLDDLWVEVRERYFWMLGQVIVLALVAAGLSWLMTLTLNLPGLWSAGISYIMTGVLAWIAVSSTDVRSLVISRYHEVLRIELPRASAEEYEDLLLAQLGSFKKANRACHRLIVFVDDLDRLAAEEMVSALDAVRTFMELPADELPKDLGVVFVISCDEDRVAAALEARRRQDASELPAVVLHRMDARRFLDRIFQFRIEIPPFPSRDLRDFAKRRIEIDMPDVARDLNKESPMIFNNVVDRMIHIHVRDPRNVVQILNAFSTSWRLAKLRERIGMGAGRPGGLRAGAVTDHPETLAALCALRVNFPDFYADLQSEPELIYAFDRRFIRNSVEGLSEHVSMLLRRYESIPSDTDGSERGDIHDNHRELRQYLLSLQGLRWPKSLQPLLLLAQDPISRQFGDSAMSVRDALVSGDEAGVLAVLGRQHDRKPLDEDQVILLRELQPDFAEESAVRRDNAAAAMAALAGRYPDADARALLTPVARQLVASRQLRWRVGLSQIQYMIPKLNPADQRDIARVLIHDFFPESGPILFRTPTDEPYSLDEAVVMIEKMVPVLLDIWQELGLESPARLRFREWLRQREVRVDQGSKELSHHYLESWVSRCEDTLLAALGVDYPELVADALENYSRDEVAFDVEAALERCLLVFNQLQTTNRGALWSLLTRFVGLQRPEAAAVAWKTMAKQQNLPNEETMTKFAVAFAERLSKDETDGDWELPTWEEGGRAFLRLIQQHAELLESEVWQACGVLAQLWSDQSQTEDLATTLLDLLERYSQGVASKVKAKWIENLTTDLATGCTEWLGIHFAEQLTAEERSAVVEELGTVVAKNPLDGHQTDMFEHFVASLTHQGRAQAEARSLALTGLQQLQRRAADEDYVGRVFPPIIPLIVATPISVIGEALMTLFKQARIQGNREAFGILHGSMVEHWPLPDEESEYDPSELFEEAALEISTAGMTEAGPSLLLSMADMVLRSVVSSDAVGQLIESGCALWRDHPEPVRKMLVSLSLPPTPEQTMTLGTNTRRDSPADLEELREAWSYIASIMTHEDLLETASLLLNESDYATDEQADLILGLWLDIQGAELPSLLKSLTEIEELQDEQGQRLWLQIERHLDAIPPKGLLPILLSSLHPDVGEQALKSIIESKKSVNKRFKSQQQQYNLGKALGEAFIQSRSLQAYSQLAEWLKSIEADAVVSEIARRDDITIEHIEALEAHFRSNRQLRTAKKRLEEV